MSTAIDERELASTLRGGPAPHESPAARFAAGAEAEGLVDVAYATLGSPVGEITLAATRRGLVKVGLPNLSVDATLGELARDVSPRVVASPKRLDAARRELDEYFAGRRHDFDLRLDWQLASDGFYLKVLRQLRRLPFGTTATYGEVAARAGNPRASRAAGTACGSNPIPLVVPCHRVVRAGGEPGNYGGGPAMKRFLLELEGAL